MAEECVFRVVKSEIEKINKQRPDPFGLSPAGTANGWAKAEPQKARVNRRVVKIFIIK